jgi:hypothetical protein
MPKFTYADYDAEKLRNLARLLIEAGGRIQAEASRLDSLKLGEISVRYDESRRKAFEQLEIFEDAIPAAIQRALREKAEGPKIPGPEKSAKKKSAKKAEAE